MYCYKDHKILTRTTKPHKSNQKQITRSFGKCSTSSGKRVLDIAGYRSQRRNSTHKNMTRIKSVTWLSDIYGHN